MAAVYLFESKTKSAHALVLTVACQELSGMSVIGKIYGPVRRAVPRTASSAILFEEQINDGMLAVV